MPDSCCVPQCTERRKPGSELSFFTIPSRERHSERRKLWINAIKRDQWSETSINNARICGKHFETGEKGILYLCCVYVIVAIFFK